LIHHSWLFSWTSTGIGQFFTTTTLQPYDTTNVDPALYTAIIVTRWRQGYEDAERAGKRRAFVAEGRELRRHCCSYREKKRETKILKQKLKVAENEQLNDILSFGLKLGIIAPINSSNEIFLLAAKICTLRRIFFKYRKSQKI